MSEQWNWISFFVGIIPGMILGAIATTVYFAKKFQKLQKEINKGFDKEAIRNMSAAFGQNIKESKLNEIANMMKKKIAESKGTAKKRVDNKKKK